MGSNVSLRNLAEQCAQEFTVNYASGSETIWVRTRTQAEIDATNIEIAEHRLRIATSYDPGNTLYNALISSLRLESDTGLISIILGAEYMEFVRQARSALPTLLPFDGSRYRTDADRQRAEKEHKKRLAKWQEDLDSKTREYMDRRREQLIAMSHDELVDKAVGPKVQLAIELECAPHLQSYMIRDCIRDGQDHSKRYFESVDDVPLQPEVRQMLLSAIEQVEQVGVLDIKNSQGRSVLSIGPAENTPEAGQDPSTED